MNEEYKHPDDARLRAMLRQSLPTASLPPRFQQEVWHRIERAEAGQSGDKWSWLDLTASWIVRPKLAFAGIAVLVLMGASLGIREGFQTARHDAQTRYLTAVAPNVLR